MIINGSPDKNETKQWRKEILSDKIISLNTYKLFKAITNYEHRRM